MMMNSKARSVNIRSATTVMFMTAVAVFASASASGQPYQAWIEPWTPPMVGEDVGWGLQTDSQGNIIVGGWTESGDNGLDGLVLKYDRTGKLLWQQTCDGTGHGDDYLGEIRVDSNDNIILHGNSLGDGTDQDFLTVKYSPDGTLLWENRYDGPGHGGDWSSTFGAVGLDAQNNVYVAGYETTADGHWGFVTIKYAPDGTREWLEKYQSSNPDNSSAWGYVVCVTDDGTVYSGGGAVNPDANQADYALLKYDTNGTLLWDRLFDSSYGDGESLYQMRLGPNEDVYMTGISDTGTGFEYCLVKYNSSGDFQWEGRYGGTTGFHYGWALDVDQNGNAYVAGASMTSGGEYDWVTVRFDTSGTLQWARRFRNDRYFGSDWPYNVVVDGAGNIYVCGYIWSWFAEGYNAAVVKYDVDGNTVWEDVRNGDAGGDDAWFQVFVDSSDQVLLTGTSLGTGTGTDLVLAKYRQNGPPTLDIDPTPLVPGDFADFTVSNVEPGAGTYLVYSTAGEGNAPVGMLDISLGLKQPKQAGLIVDADASGIAAWNLKIPNSASGLDVWFQSAQYNVVTNIVATSVQ